MALFNLNGFSAEEVTSGYVYENLFPGLQHINGKGVTDKYTVSEDVRSVTKIDVMRLKADIPAFRQLGAVTNGGYANQYNTAYNGNSPQSVTYTIGVDLFFDRITPIPVAQLLANKVAFESIVQKQIVDTMAWGINVVTFAKQIEAFFRNTENFNIPNTNSHAKGSIVAGDITATEIANAVFQYDTSVSNDAVAKFIDANASLTDGVPQIGAYIVPIDERQAFITSAMNSKMKAQYSANASEAAAQINATGFMNPFTQTEGKRIDTRTGLCGMFDGVGMYLLNSATKRLVYIYLGILGTGSDSSGNLPACRGYLDQVDGMIVYGAGTCRGIAVAPTVAVKEDPYNAQSVNLCPLAKVGVDVLHGATIKLIVNGGAALASAWAAADIAKLMNTLTFSPIQNPANARTVLATYGFNDGTTK